eukprot:2150293-Ditylum_brightwellii.AAC.1
MATQRCRQMLLQFSWPQNQEMAPTMHRVYSVGKTTAGDIIPLHQWCIGSIILVGEGGGGDMGGVMA